MDFMDSEGRSLQGLCWQSSTVRGLAILGITAAFASIYAQDAKPRHALLYPHKAVVVNNEPITHTTLLFTADKIGTGDRKSVV